MRDLLQLTSTLTVDNLSHMATQPPNVSSPAISIRIRFCILLLLSVMAYGTVGYRVIEGWSWLDSLYMTVITISTVGFTEVRQLDAAGRVHTILLIICGVGTVATTLSVLFEQLFHRQLKIIMEKRGMQRTIATLSGHTIVCGFGRMGRMIATSLQKAGQSVVVIERIPPTADKIEKLGFLVVQATPPTRRRSARPVSRKPPHWSRRSALMPTTFS